MAAQVVPSGASVDAGAEAVAAGTAPPEHPLRRLSTPPIGTETQPSAEGSEQSRAEQSRAEPEASRAMGAEERVAALRGDALRDDVDGRAAGRRGAAR